VRVTVAKASEQEGKAGAGQAEEALGQSQASLLVLPCESEERAPCPPECDGGAGVRRAHDAAEQRGQWGGVRPGQGGSEGGPVRECGPGARGAGGVQLHEGAGGRCPNICSARKLEVQQGSVSMWMERCAGDSGGVLDAVHCGSACERREVELLGLQFLEQVARGLKAIQVRWRRDGACGHQAHECAHSQAVPGQMEGGLCPGSLKVADFGHAFPSRSGAP